jgi:hypothetical protein
MNTAEVNFRLQERVKEEEKEDRLLICVIYS